MPAPDDAAGDAVPTDPPSGTVGDPIRQLLAGDYRDPETGELLAAESRAIAIDDSLDGNEAALVDSLGVGRIVAVISDRDTHAVLGRRVERSLEAGGYRVQSIVLDAHPVADDITVKLLLATVAPDTELVISVGSGTLTDLTKMVAFQRGCPQAVFATAPSMNGYTSVSASIAIDGMKRSFRTRTPLGIFMDLRVIAAAPVRMISAGLGDSLCRSTAQADWLLQHLLLDRPYRLAPFALLAADEAHLLADPRALVEGDTRVMRHLVRTLVLSGFGMTLCNGSYPASQGEHLLSHFVEMTGTNLPHTFHGEQIAVCTVAMAELQARVLESPTAPVLRPCTIDREELVGRYGTAIGEACWEELSQKRLDATATDAVNARLAGNWDAIRDRIRAVTLPTAQLRDVLQRANAPIHPDELGWPAPLFDTARRHAREIRNRYTFLDLVTDAR